MSLNMIEIAMVLLIGKWFFLGGHKTEDWGSLLCGLCQNIQHVFGIFAKHKTYLYLFA